MKYLDKNIYEKACYSGDELYNEKWQNCLASYYKVFEENRYRLPVEFLKEYEKSDFHDNILHCFSIHRRALKNNTVFDIEMHILDYENREKKHILLFKEVDNIRFDSNTAVDCEWLYAEILPIDGKRMSLEIKFVSSDLYFEFSKLRYKKAQGKTKHTSRKSTT